MPDFHSYDQPWPYDLVSVVISDGVTFVGDNAFANQSRLEQVRLPNSLTSIGDSAFLDCSSLSGIAIPEGVTVIGVMAFARCGELKRITLPEGLRRIGAWAFESCLSLRSVYLPTSLERIGRAAFSDCTSLQEALYPGSREQWETVDIRADNEPLLRASPYASDEPPSEAPIPSAPDPLGSSAGEPVSFPAPESVPASQSDAEPPLPDGSEEP